MIPVIIIGIILLYAGYVIWKKFKNMKQGKFCGSGCEGCGAKKKCDKN